MKLAIETILPLQKVQEIAGKLDRAYKAGRFSDGKLTANGAARRVKNNHQLDSRSPLQKELGNQIRECLLTSEIFKVSCHPKIVKEPIFSYYNDGMEYGLHVDAAIMGKALPIRTDLSVTVFLNNPDEYEGGELEIVTSLGVDSIKLNAGDAIVYPSTSLHCVRPVTSGTRKVAVTWLQSRVRDAEKRQILFDSFKTLNALDNVLPGSDEAALARKNYHNLLRLWIDM